MVGSLLIDAAYLAISNGHGAHIARDAKIHLFNYRNVKRFVSVVPRRRHCLDRIPLSPGSGNLPGRDPLPPFCHRVDERHADSGLLAATSFLCAKAQPSFTRR